MKSKRPDAQKLVPKGYELLHAVKTAKTAYIAFLWNEDKKEYALVGIHLARGEWKRGMAIPFEEKYDDATTKALETFAAGAYTLEGDSKDENDEVEESEDYQLVPHGCGQRTQRPASKGHANHRGRVKSAPRTPENSNPRLPRQNYKDDT